MLRCGLKRRVVASGPLSEVVGWTGCSGFWEGSIQWGQRLAGHCCGLGVLLMANAGIRCLPTTNKAGGVPQQ